MEPSPHPKQLLLQDHATSPSKDSLPCISCNYNLTGLPHHGTCPECGHEIQDSIRHARGLPSRSLGHTRHTLGLMLMFIGFLGAIIVAAAGVLRGFSFTLRMFDLELHPAFLAAPLVILIGGLLATWPLPVAFACKPCRLRLLARYTAIASSIPIGAACWFWHRQQVPQLQDDWLVVSVLTSLTPTLVLIALSVCIQWSKLRRSRCLARDKSAPSPTLNPNAPPHKI